MILEELAQRYPQLYLTIGDGMEERYNDVVLRGKDVENPVLKVFRGTKQDALWNEQTPAGPVEVLYLANREDFENFLRLMTCKCRPEQFPRTMGAMTLNGVINWQKIRAHEAEYKAAGGTNWFFEKKRFTADPENYKDTLILLGDGPYSNLPSDKAGFPEAEWIGLSRKIRLYHECSHVICHRRYPAQKEPVWDEITADCIGLIGALNSYDPRLAALLLGVSESGYLGGRLENYIPEERLEQTALQAHALIKKLAALRNAMPTLAPYDFLMELEERQKELWTTPT